MDSGQGHFNMFDSESELAAAIKKGQGLPTTVATAKTDSLKAFGVFTVGEELTVKGSRFRVKNIARHTLTLRLLAKYEAIPISPLEEMARFKADMQPEGT